MTALALVSTNDHDVSVNTEVAQQAMAEQFEALSIVTAYSDALENTVIKGGT